MRNSSLVECERAPTIHRGSSPTPKPWLLTMVRGVGERSSGRSSGRSRRSRTARSGGGRGSENAGMSSALGVQISHTVSLRVPKQGLSTSGQSGLRRSRRAKPMDNRLIFLYHSSSQPSRKGGGRAMGGRSRLGSERQTRASSKVVGCARTGKTVRVPLRQAERRMGAFSLGRGQRG